MAYTLVIAAALLGALGLAAAWWLGVLSNRGALGGLTSVASLGAIAPPAWALGVLAGFVLATAATLVRRPALISPRAVTGAIALGLASVLASLATRLGFHASITSAAVVLAILAAAHAPDRWLSFPSTDTRGELELRRRDRRIAVALWVLVAAIHAGYSMHRYWAFGAGSWDLGCMIHNVYRASRFLDSTSTVLGEVDYLGDHFMIGIYLFAPIFWLHTSGYSVLAVQAVSLASASPAIFSIARHKGAPLPVALALAVAAGLSFGMQSASYFDAHEITLGLGFLAWALWAIEVKRLRLASVLLAAFALFKESLGAYVVGLGLLLTWRALRDRERTSARVGAAWVAAGAAWFVLVNRVLMPAFIARANPPEAHETYADFGPTVFTAALGMLRRPLSVIGGLFVPDEKLHSLLVTFGGLGWLSLLAPELLLPALPLLAERFLSSKASMWEMGYHYAAPLSLYAAWAAALAWPRIAGASRLLLDTLGPGLGVRAPVWVAAYVLGSTALVNSIGYRHPANYHRLSEPYFSTPVRRAQNAEAIGWLDALGREARLAVQNRMLPHLADRAFIYRLGDYEKADYVLLNVSESSWPWDDGYALRLTRQLYGSPDWRLVFAAGETAIFARAGRAHPPAEPSPELRLPRSP